MRFDEVFVQKLLIEIASYRSALLWVRDGLDHFTTDEGANEKQRLHLQENIDRVLYPKSVSEEDK